MVWLRSIASAASGVIDASRAAPHRASVPRMPEMCAFAWHPRPGAARSRRVAAGEWAARLPDERSHRVLFVSHCLLDQNVRYPRGAFRPGVVPEAVAPFIVEGDGVYQMPCPEQAAWGGMARPFILRFYGSKYELTYRFRALLLPLFLAWTRWRCRLLARRVAAHAADHVRCGCRIVGVLGVGNSPSCGVRQTLDLARALPVVASLDVATVDRRTFNERAVRDCAVEGEGIYIQELRRALSRRRLAVPFLEYQPPGDDAA